MLSLTFWKILYCFKKKNYHFDSDATAEEVGQIINNFFVDCSVIDAKKVVAVGIHSSNLHKGEDWLPVIGQ